MLESQPNLEHLKTIWKAYQLFISKKKMVHSHISQQLVSQNFMPKILLPIILYMHKFSTIIGKNVQDSTNTLTQNEFKVSGDWLEQFFAQYNVSF